MESHPLLVNSHSSSAGRQPTLIVVQIRRAVSGLEQQATLASDKSSQELRDFSGHFNLSRTGVGLQIADNSRRISIHLLGYYNRLTVVDEMLHLQCQCLGAEESWEE